MAGIGIVGTGWGARVQVPTFREAGLNVVAIAGSRWEKTRKSAEELGLRAVEDWRELVSAPDVDLVSIVTPPSEHREMTLAALEAGKHVLCEKPTALNAGEAEEMLAAARSHPDRLTLIDHELRFLPSWREARTRIGAEIGPIRYAEVRYSSPARGDRGRAWNWWSDAAKGGGIWGAVGSHFIDALRYFGMEPEAVRGVMATIIDERPFGDATRAVTADDFASVQLRMRGGALAVLQCSTVSTGPDEAAVITIHGEHGAMRFIGEEVLLSQKGSPFERIRHEPAGSRRPGQDAGAPIDAGAPMDADAPERRLPGGRSAGFQPAPTSEERPGNSPGGAFGTGTLHLGRALRAALDDGDRNALAPAATFEDGLAQQRVLDAARRSSSDGAGWIAL